MLNARMLAGWLFPNALLMFALGFVAAADSARAAEFKIDPVDSFVNFRVKHMNTGYAYGRFNEISGVFMVDDATGAGMTFDLEVKAASVDTNNTKRDQHLKGPDFFNAKEFPTIEFKSRLARRNGEKGLEVAGELTLRGVTRAINMRLEHVGEGKTPTGAVHTGYEGSFVLKRSEFGMTFGEGMLGDDVTVYVAFEGERK